MTIKEVNVSNPDLISLVKELDLFFEELWGSSASYYQRFHQLSQMAHSVVYYDNNKPVGCGCFKVIDKHTIEIKRMYVRNEYRHLKIASQIIENLEKEAIKCGYHIATLQTGKDMSGSIQFYAKMGYYLVENYGPFIDDELCVCMKKELD